MTANWAVVACAVVTAIATVWAARVSRTSSKRATALEEAMTATGGAEQVRDRAYQRAEGLNVKAVEALEKRLEATEKRLDESAERERVYREELEQVRGTAAVNHDELVRMRRAWLELKSWLKAQDLKVPPSLWIEVEET